MDAIQRELWDIWDLVKRALDKQEELRGTDALWPWLAKAAPFWNDITTRQDLVDEWVYPSRVPFAYRDWLTARGHESWSPSPAGPLFWRAPAATVREEQQRLEEIKARKEEFKRQLREQQRDILKATKKQLRAEEKARKKEMKHGGVESTSGEGVRV